MTFLWHFGRFIEVNLSLLRCLVSGSVYVKWLKAEEDFCETENINSTRMMIRGQYLHHMMWEKVHEALTIPWEIMAYTRIWISTFSYQGIPHRSLYPSLWVCVYVRIFTCIHMCVRVSVCVYVQMWLYYIFYKLSSDAVSSCLW